MRWGLGLLVAVNLMAQGREVFENRCAACHGADGNGGELGPPIVNRLRRRNDQELAALITSGIPARGMPAFSLPPKQMTELVAFLRTLKAIPRSGGPVRKRIETTDGRSLEGLALVEDALELQLKTDDGRVHLLRPAGSKFRPVTSEVNWATYNGDAGANRYSTLAEINKGNVRRLAPKWVFQFPNTSNIETTPLVVDGLMYVTAANECYALDAGTGREVWHYQRPRTRGLVGNAAGGFNRGVAVDGERLFMVTDHAHIIALNRHTGELLWETPMADWHQNYNATSAPLVAGGVVVSGTAGGD